MAKKSIQALKITDEHKALRELRLSKNLSLEEASGPLGIKSKALGHIENGRVKLTAEFPQSVPAQFPRKCTTC